MGQTTFISHRYRDKEKVNNLESFTQAKGGKIPGKLVRIEPSGVLQTKSAIDKQIKATIKECDTVLVANGQDTHNSPWVKREVEIGVSMNKRVIVAQLPGTNGGLPPALKQGRHAKVKCKPADIAKAIAKPSAKKK